MNLTLAIALICAAYLIGRGVGKDLGRTEARPVRFLVDINGERLGGFGIANVRMMPASEFPNDMPPTAGPGRTEGP